MITASRLELARQCPAHLTIPHREVPTPDAEAGTERHADYENRIMSGDVPEAIASRWPLCTWRAEVAFGYDMASGAGRELGVGLQRNYSSAGPFEICGTADAVGIERDTDGRVVRLVIVDWKSYRRVTRASANAQLHVAALALSRAHDADAVECVIHYEARPMDVAEIDALEIEAFAADLTTILDEAARVRAAARDGKPVTFSEGEWCRYCPSFYDCPAKRALREKIERHPALVAPEQAVLPFANNDDAAEAYEFADRVRMLLKRIDAALYARAKDRPIPLRSGKVFGPVQKLGNEKLDGDTVYAVVKEKYGQGIADAAVVRSATKKRLGEALDFAGVASKASAAMGVLEEVRKRGGASRETKTVIDEYEPTPQLVAGDDAA